MAFILLIKLLVSTPKYVCMCVCVISDLPTVYMYIRGSHSHKTCITIHDQDQNGIKRSRGYLGLNRAIKEHFK